MSTSTLTLLRPRLAPPHTPTLTLTQAGQRRAASLLRRPHRPYTFTQLLTLSDGSTFTHRTTSPAPLYKSTRDARNSPLWNPSNVRLANVEEDEAGRLKAFRRKFGRGWDAEEESDVTTSTPADDASSPSSDKQPSSSSSSEEGEEDASSPPPSKSSSGGDNLMDLIASYGQQDAAATTKAMKGGVVKKGGSR